MQFREIGKGTLFEMLIDEKFKIAVKTGERLAILLAEEEEIKVHPNKKVNLPEPIRPGTFALETDTGKPILVERITDKLFRCDYIVRIDRQTLVTPKVSIFDREKGKTGETAGEVYIILSRAEKALENAQKLLETVKVMMEDLK